MHLSTAVGAMTKHRRQSSDPTRSRARAVRYDSAASSTAGDSIVWEDVTAAGFEPVGDFCELCYSLLFTLGTKDTPCGYHEQLSPTKCKMCALFLNS